jgi:hypothetical protein
MKDKIKEKIKKFYNLEKPRSFSAHKKNYHILGELDKLVPSLSPFDTKDQQYDSKYISFANL